MSKPSIFQYHSVTQYVRDLLIWKKEHELNFSIRGATKKLPRCSPSLVTLVIHGRRKLTPERAKDFSQLLGLDAQERRIFQLKAQEEYGLNSTPSPDFFNESGWYAPSHHGSPKNAGKNPAPAANRHKDNCFLAHWLHPYIKDMARLKGFSYCVSTLFQMLEGLATKKQIEHSLKFLFSHGYFRRTLEGRIVENVDVTESSDDIPAEKIRKFHKKALEIAAQKVEKVPCSNREAQTILLALNHESFLLLKQKIKDWSEEVTAFAEANQTNNELLYQVVLNLSPIAGSTENLNSHSTRRKNETETNR
jgi:uncharacterized protein (TIGR02147 family)